MRDVTGIKVVPSTDIYTPRAAVQISAYILTGVYIFLIVLKTYEGVNVSLSNFIYL